MQVRVGTGPVSWGVLFAADPQQIAWQRFLDEVSLADYRWIELGPLGYLPTKLEILKPELDGRHLQVSGSFIVQPFEDPDVWPNLEQELVQLGDVLARLGAKFIVLIDAYYRHQTSGELLRRTVPDQDGWKRFLDTIHRAARFAEERFALKIAFHPHCETHVEYQQQVESLLENTDPAHVYLCLDTGHFAYRGGNPVEFMRKYHRRIPYLHLKNVNPAILRKVQEEKLSYAQALKLEMFCEPAVGMVDFRAFQAVLHEIDWDGWATVEQDMYAVPFDKPLPIARRTRAYLREIGLG